MDLLVMPEEKGEEDIMKQKQTKELKEWADKVKEFWGYRCAVCGSESKLNAHHLLPRQIKKYRTDLGNGICLCPKCHRLSFTLSAHQNPIAFYIWFEKKYPSWLEKIKEKIKNM